MTPPYLKGVREFCDDLMLINADDIQKQGREKFWMKCRVWKVWNLPDSKLEFASARVPLMVCFRAGYRAKSIYIFPKLNNLEKICSFKSPMLDIPSFPP